VPDVSKPNQLAIRGFGGQIISYTILDIDYDSFAFAYTCRIVNNEKLEDIFVLSKTKTASKESQIRLRRTLAKYTDIKYKQIMPIAQDC
jgi:hypothetical protein